MEDFIHGSIETPKVAEFCTIKGPVMDSDLYPLQLQVIFAAGTSKATINDLIRSRIYIGKS